MINSHTNEIIEHWKYLAPIIHEPRNQTDYDKLAQLLDALLDMAGEDESHQLMGLIDIVSHMISIYDEREEDLISSATGIDALKFLMTQHNLKQSDLTDIASQGVLSEILNGKRKINLTQVKKLAKKFNLSVNTFID